MARPDHDVIQTYVNITGASESNALQKLEEHGGDLNEALNAHFNGWTGHNTNGAAPQYSERNEALNAHFNGGDGHISNAAAPQYGFIDMQNQTQVGSRGSLLPFLSSVRSLNPFSLLDPNYRRSFLSGLSTSFSSGQAPSISHPREARELPLGFEDGSGQSGHFGLRPTRTAFSNGPDFYGNNGEEGYNPSALNNSHLYGSYMEEDMLQAAIEASKRETEESGQDNILRSPNGLYQTQLHLEDDFARAVSLSLKTAEEEKTMRDCLQIMEVDNSTDVEGLNILERENGRLKQGNSSHGVNDGEEKPMLGQSSNHGCSEYPQLVGDVFHSEAVYPWGDISSKEHDEAVTLEAAYFGDITESTLYPAPYLPHPQSIPDKGADPSSRHVACSPSSSLAAQRLLQEQQDDDYLASLKADREKELKAVKVADKCSTKGEEISRKVLEEEEFERKLLAVKEISLPQEPCLDDENAVTLLVRMPDGSRHGRRFVKSDRLKSLFDFIDAGKAVEPGTYRVARSYPRRAFSVDDSASTLNEVGLTSKHEALFLEMI